MNKIIIAIDGYSSCGKSSTAKAISSIFGYSYIDTGAMYRAVTYFFLDQYINISDPKSVQKALESIDIKFVFNSKTQTSDIFLNGLNIEKEIRKMYISDKVSEVSAIADVRKTLVKIQQKMGKKAGLVMDGRDIGTTVFPDAELKIFMTADPILRAERRQKELLDNNQMIPLQEVLENLQKRDHIDSTRIESPLRKAADAIEIDNSHLTFDEQVDIIISLALNKIYNSKTAIS